MLASGLAILRTRAPPVALAWLAIALGLISFDAHRLDRVPRGGVVWVGVASVLLYRRGERAPAAGSSTRRERVTAYR